MASGRILKTQISFSEQVNDLSAHAALLFTWMIPHADDFGRMHGNARKIKAQVVPMRDDYSTALVDTCLNELAKAGLIRRYPVAGEYFICFPTWELHQSGLHKRTRSKLPAPEVGEGAEVPGNSGAFRPEQETEQEQKPEQKPEPETELKPESERELKPAPAPKAVNAGKHLNGLLTSYGITGDLAADFSQYRQAKHAPITKTVLEGLAREAAKAGIPIAQAVRTMMERNWQGFKAEWVKPAGDLPAIRAAPAYLPKDQRGGVNRAAIDSTATRLP
ncbi:MAG: hypothetical protein PHU14_01120 [Methylovulum sp.]|nr:hypothetical protein [Methylovulum sp.]